MKKLVGLLLFVTFFIFPLCANAYIIGDVNLTLYYSSPTGYVTFPTGYGNYYLDYDVSLNGASQVEAFCVEDTNAPPTTTPYTLLSIDSGLSAFGLDDSRYLAAAWVAEYYATHYEGKGTAAVQDAWKAAAQIAVWEIIFDSSFDLTKGTFQSTNPYASKANDIWSQRPTTFPTSSSQWALAVNPTVTQGSTIDKLNYQNYLVPYDVPAVPEPATLLLMGFGSGIMGTGIKRLRKKIKKG
jgi:hypothetical protein